MHPICTAIGSMTFECEVIFGISWVDIVYCHPPLYTAQGKPSRLVCLLVVKNTDTAVLKEKLYMWASSWENASSGVSYQVRLKLACSATEASMRPEILVTETRDIMLSKQRTTTAQIRLRRCAGWSVPLLFAYNTFSHGPAHLYYIKDLKSKLSIVEHLSASFLDERIQDTLDGRATC